MTDRYRLVVLFGGQSAEHEVSRVTARHVVAAASPERFAIDSIAIGRDGQWTRTDAGRAVEQGVAGELPAFERHWRGLRYDAERYGDVPAIRALKTVEDSMRALCDRPELARLGPATP